MEADTPLTYSESSLFVAPHCIILKTCGTTLNLLGLYRIIEIARQYCGFTNVWRCFYSRKSFFFPERQSGPHKDWRDEVSFLDSVFGESGCWRSFIIELLDLLPFHYRLCRYCLHCRPYEPRSLATLPHISQLATPPAIRLCARLHIPTLPPCRFTLAVRCIKQSSYPIH